MYASQWKEASRRRLVDDASNLMRDVEDYLAASAGQTGESLAASRQRILDSLAAARAGLEDVERDAVERARAADALVHAHAWKAVAIAACLGVAAGWLATRR